MKKFIILTVIFCLATSGFQPPVYSEREIPKNELAPPKTIVILQDAHESLAAQEQIASIIRRIAVRRGSVLVGTEGAEGSLEAGAIRVLDTPERVSIAAQKFMKEGYIGGAEFAAITASQPVYLFGIEEETLYRGNLEQYRNLIREKSSTLANFSRLEQLVRGESRISNQRYQKEADQLLENMTTGNTALLTWFHQADPMLRWKRIRIPADSAYLQLRKIAAISETLDEEAFLREYDAMKKEIVASATQDEKNFLTALEKKSTDSASEKESLFRWIDLGERHSVDFSNYPQVLAKARMHALLDSISNKMLFDEIRELIWQLKFELAEIPADRERIEILRYLDLAKRQSTGEMTAPEFEAIERMERTFNPEARIVRFFESNNPAKGKEAERILNELKRVLKTSHDFYQMARERSFVMAEKLLEEMNRTGDDSAVLVSGGFHTEHFREFFNSKGAVSIIWSPKIMPDDGKVPYHDRLLKPAAAAVSLAFVRNETFAGNVEIFEAMMRRELGLPALEETGNLDIVAEEIGASSLGAKQPENTFLFPSQNSGELFRNILEGKNLAYVNAIDVPVFSAQKSDRVWIIAEKWRRHKEKALKPSDVIRIFFTDRELGGKVAKEYENLVQMLYLREKDGEFYPDLLIYALAKELEQANVPDLKPAVELYQARAAKYKDKTKLLREIYAREGVVSNTILALTQILEQRAEKNVVKISELTLRNDLNSFAVSPALGLFNVSPDGTILNWDEVLTAYVAVKAPKMQSLMKVYGTPEIMPTVQNSGNKYDAMMRLAWSLYFPSSGRWTAKHSISLMENEFGEAIGQYQFGAFWISGRQSEYVILGPRVASAGVHPFLRLMNPTDQFQIFRIQNPRSGKEQSELIQDPLEKAIITGAFASRAFHIQSDPPEIYNPNTGLPESDRLDPVKKIEGIHDQILKMIGAEVIHEGESIIYSVPGIDPQDQELFDQESDYARKFIPNEKEDHWMMKAVESLSASKPAPQGDFIKDLRTSMEAMSDQVRSVVPEKKADREKFLKETQYDRKKENPFDKVAPLRVVFKSGRGVALHEGVLHFIFDGEEKGQFFRKFETPGFRGVGRYQVLAALIFLENQNLSGDAKEIYESWRPWLFELYRENQNEIKGKSLGELTGAGLATAQLQDVSAALFSNTFYDAERFSSGEDRARLEDLIRNQDGPYEELVYWDALKKGILFPDLAELLESMPTLKITIVDDHLSGKQIYQELLKKDPERQLRKFLSEGRLVIPENPALREQIRESFSRLEKVYGQFKDSFLGIVFADEEAGRPVSAKEMKEKAPRGFRFVAQGKVDLGVVAHAALTLVRGTPQDLFQNRYQNEDVWSLESLLPEQLGAMLARYQAQILLQTSA